MSRFARILCLLPVITTFSIVSAAPEKVNVTVYYESLCPDSKAFINKQLYPTLNASNALAQRVNLHLVPYGKSKHIYDKTFKEYNFTCHHGEDECAGNTIHACALRLAGPDAPVSPSVLTFIDCLMEKVDRTQTPNVFPIAPCAVRSEGLNAANVENCAKHKDGRTYLADFGLKTEQLRPSLRSVPTVIVNAADESAEAQENFAGVVCKYLRAADASDVPAACDAAGGARTVAAPLGAVLVLVAGALSRF